MAAKKRSPKQPAPPVVAADLSTWLLSFEGDEEGDEPQLLSFDMLLQAPDVDDAVDVARERLHQLRATTTLFTTPCKLYLHGLYKVPQSIPKPALLNYKSQTWPDDFSAISCELPEQADVKLEIFSTSPEEEGEFAREPFITFE